MNECDLLRHKCNGLMEQNAFLQSTINPALMKNGNARVKAEVVELTVNLPIVSSEFDETKQAGFKLSIADAAGVHIGRVEIVNFLQTSLRGNGVAALPSRQLLAATIDVETRIATTDGNAKDLIKALKPDTINLILQNHGLPEGKLTKTRISKNGDVSENGDVSSFFGNIPIEVV